MSDKIAINGRLAGENRRYDIKLDTTAINEEYGKNAFQFGEQGGQTTAGITSLDTTQFFENEVVSGDGAVEITGDAENISGLIDPSSTTIPYSTGTLSINTDSDGFASFDSDVGGFSESVSGDNNASSLSSIIASLTGLSTSTDLGENLKSGGNLPSLKKTMDAGQTKSSSLTSDLKSSYTNLGATGAELENVDKVSQSVSFGSVEGIVSKTSAINSLNSSAPIKDTVQNSTAIPALNETATPVKNELDETNTLSKIVRKAKDAFGSITSYLGEVTRLDTNSLSRNSKGLLANGILQDISEGTNNRTRNFLQGLTNNTVQFDPSESQVLLGKIAGGSDKEIAEAVQTVATQNPDLTERERALIATAQPNSTKNMIDEITETGKKTGYTQAEIDNAVEKIKSIDTEILNFDTTISGSIVIDAPLFDEPTLLSDAENKWIGRGTERQAFTFIASVEELEREFRRIRREITEVVVHATETHSNKNLGSEEIHFIHNELGKDGIGYHYVIRRDGRLQRGRPVNKEGDHANVNGHNSRSIALVMVGGINTSTGQNNIGEFRSSASFTREQFTTLETFLSKFYQKYPGGQVFGHSDVDVDELDPYFDVVDYVESVFNKRNKTTDPLNSGPLQSSELT